MKASELTAAVEQLFDCKDGEPRAWTRNPPIMRLANSCDDLYLDLHLPDEDKNWYAVFGYSDASCTEEQLVDALFADIRAMHFLCTNARPTLLWRRRPQYHEGIDSGQHFRQLSVRLVIPEIAHGSLRHEWLKVRSYKPEGSPFPSPRPIRTALES